MDSALREELLAEVDEVWAESLRHLPLVGGEQDQTRAVSEILATLRTGEREVERARFGRGSSARGGLLAGGGTLRLDRGMHPDLVIRKGDKIVALWRDGLPAFEVMAVDDRSHLRLICELGDA